MSDTAKTTDYRGQTSSGRRRLRREINVSRELCRRARSSSFDWNRSFRLWRMENVQRSGVTFNREKFCFFNGRLQSIRTVKGDRRGTNERGVSHCKVFVIVFICVRVDKSGMHQSNKTDLYGLGIFPNCEVLRYWNETDVEKH